MSKIVYVVGSFTSVTDALGTHARNRAAALDVETGLFTAWNPNLNGSASAVAVDTSGVYIVGSFSQVGGITRNQLCKVNKTTGALDGTFASALLSGNSNINCLLLAGGWLWVGGGFFNTAPAVFKRGPVRFNPTSGALDTWFGDVGGAFGHVGQYGMAALGSNIYVGGDFNQVNVSTLAVTRNYAAAWDLTSGALQAFAPDTGTDGLFSGIIRSVGVSGSDIVLAGHYGSPFQYIRKHNATTGAVLAYSGVADNGASSVAIGSGKVYAAGSFTTLQGVARSRGGALDETTAALNAFDPNLTGGSNFANVVILGNNLTYIGGSFTLSNGISRNNIAVFDAAGALQ